MYIDGGLGSRLVGVEPIGVDGYIVRLSSQDKSLSESNLLPVLIDAASSVDFDGLFFSFCGVLFAIQVSVKFLPYRLGRNHLHWSMRSPCCVVLAWVVLLVDFVLGVGRPCT